MSSILGWNLLCVLSFFLPVPIFLLFWRQKKPEKFEPEYAVPEDKPNKCAADQKAHYTGVYADIQVEENGNPLLRVSDDKTVTFSQPLFEKMDRSPNIVFSDLTRHDETKFNEQDFKEKMYFSINPVWTVMMKKYLLYPFEER